MAEDVSALLMAIGDANNLDAVNERVATLLARLDALMQAEGVAPDAN